jgi:hypothetical protein
VWVAPEKNMAAMAICNRGGQEADRACDDAVWSVVQRYIEQAPAPKKQEKAP